MNKIKYLITIENYLYKYTIMEDSNSIDFFKKRRRKRFLMFYL